MDHRERDARRANSTTKSRSLTASSELAVTPSKPSSRGRRLAVERVARARPARPTPSGRDVRPAARVGQPAAVALEHLDVGEEVVGEEHRLGRLDVGRARQDRRRRRARRARRGRARGRRIAPRRGGRSPAAVQSRRSVATWSLRERPVWSLPADRADPLGQRRLEVEVDVLERAGPRRASRPRRRRGGPRARRRASSTSSAVRRPARPSPRTWAIEPDEVVGGERRVDLDRAREVGRPAGRSPR